MKISLIEILQNLVPDIPSENMSGMPGYYLFM